MRRRLVLLLALLLAVPNVVHAAVTVDRDVAGGGGGGSAESVTVDTGDFDGNLSASDATVQDALETLDELVSSENTVDGDVNFCSGATTDCQFNLQATGRDGFLLWNGTSDLLESTGIDISRADPAAKGFRLRLGKAQYNAAIQPSAVTGLRVWFKADAIVGLNDGDLVSTWNDSSSNANNATSSGADRPTYQTNELNSLPVVRFDGATDFMVTGANSGISGDANLTVFVVLKLNTTHSNFEAAVQQGPISVGNAWSITFDENQPAIDYVDNRVRSSEVMGTSAYAIVVAKKTAGSITLTSSPVNVDGEYPAQATEGASTAPNITNDTIELGRLEAGREISADIAEIIVYNAALSASNYAGVLSYLANKYNLTTKGYQDDDIWGIYDGDGDALARLESNKKFGYGLGSSLSSGTFHIKSVDFADQAFIVQGAVGQTANLFVAANSAGSDLFWLDPEGDGNWAGELHSYRLNINSLATNKGSLFIERFAGQTVNLMLINDSDDSQLFQIDADGDLMNTRQVTSDADGKTFTAYTECNTVQVNGGAGIWNLPEASTAIGCEIQFITGNASNFDINPANGDQILLLTDSTGDAIRNATVGNTVTLVAIDGTNWVASATVGTWSDVN